MRLVKRSRRWKAVLANEVILPIAFGDIVVITAHRTFVRGHLVHKCKLIVIELERFVVVGSRCL